MSTKINNNISNKFIKTLFKMLTILLVVIGLQIPIKSYAAELNNAVDFYNANK